MKDCIFNQFHCFAYDVGRGKHDFGKDIIKAVLSSVRPNDDAARLKDIKQIPNGGGYTTNGKRVKVKWEQRANGVAELTGQAVKWHGTGNGIKCQFVILFNASHLSKPLLGWWDAGAPFWLPPDSNFICNFNDGGRIVEFKFAPKPAIITARLPFISRQLIRMVRAIRWMLSWIETALSPSEAPR